MSLLKKLSILTSNFSLSYLIYLTLAKLMVFLVTFRKVQTVQNQFFNSAPFCENSNRCNFICDITIWKIFFQAKNFKKLLFKKCQTPLILKFLFPINISVPSPTFLLPCTPVPLSPSQRPIPLHPRVPSGTHQNFQRDMLQQSFARAL